MLLSLLLQAQTQNTVIDYLRQAIKLHKEIILQSDKDINEIELQFLSCRYLSKRVFKWLQVLHMKFETSKEIAMSEFNKDKLDEFLGIVRKYMQVRGSLTQRDLAEKSDIGVSTMSRFLTRKTADINPQIVAKIVAVLEIPLHEMIDFVEEDFTEKFVRLVKFYKGTVLEETDDSFDDKEEEAQEDTVTKQTAPIADPLEDALLSGLSTGTAQRPATAKVQIGGKSRSIPFSPDESGRNSELSLKEKLNQLTPRQKAYMSDFLSLDMEARDLIVDLGNDLFRYFRQKGMIT